jgi:hypothetical protein
MGAPTPGFGWRFCLANGFEGTDLTQNNLYVMVYYPGRTRHGTAA